MISETSGMDLVASRNESPRKVKAFWAFAELLEDASTTESELREVDTEFLAKVAIEMGLPGFSTVDLPHELFKSENRISAIEAARNLAADDAKPIQGVHN